MRDTNWVRRERPGDRENKPSNDNVVEPSAGTLEEIAERMVRGYVDHQGQWVVSPSLVRMSILSALRNEREACAVVAEICHPQPCICQTCLIRAEAGAAIRRRGKESNSGRVRKILRISRL